MFYSPVKSYNTQPASYSEYMATHEKTLDSTAVCAAVVRALMNKKGLSEHKLAKLSGVSQKTINNLLNATSAPTVPTLQALAKALEVPTKSLLDENYLQAMDPGEEKFLELFRAADKRGKDVILSVAEKEAKYGDKS